MSVAIRDFIPVCYPRDGAVYRSRLMINSQTTKERKVSKPGAASHHNSNAGVQGGPQRVRCDFRSQLKIC
jgi:hypothetical protein